MRKPTHADADLLLRLYEIRRDPELRRARAWFLTEFHADSWAEIQARYLSHSDEDRWFRMTVSYWELVATLVNRGVLHAELFFDHTGEDVVTWNRCTAWLEGARAEIRPTYLYQFERMVRDHLAFRQRTIAAFQAQRERATRRDGATRPAARTPGRRAAAAGRARRA
jgi:hypothetical protein